jgi:hypothetical protein
MMVMSSPNSIKKEIHQYFKEILAHEVGHLLSQWHDHKETNYKYTIAGLSSNHPDKLKVTLNNVLTIINDEDNQNESFK